MRLWARAMEKLNCMNVDNIKNIFYLFYNLFIFCLWIQIFSHLGKTGHIMVKIYFKFKNYVWHCFDHYKNKKWTYYNKIFNLNTTPLSILLSFLHWLKIEYWIQDYKIVAVELWIALKKNIIYLDHIFVNFLSMENRQQ